MDPRFFRKYADLVEAAEKDIPVQLDEGVMDTVTQYVKQLVQKASPGLMQQVTDLVTRALGKPIEQLTMADATLANAKKVLAANQQMSEAEEYQNPSYNNWEYGYERADIPNTLAKNKKQDAKIGGVVGLFAGTLISASIPGLMAIGLPILGIAVIIGAIIGYKMASPDRGLTGRYKDKDGELSTSYYDDYLKKTVNYERDPDFDKNK